MSIVVTYPTKFKWLMRILLMFMFCGCGLMNHSGKSVLFTNNAPLPLVDDSPPCKPAVSNNKPDTIISHYSDTPKVAHIRHVEKVLIHDGLLPSYDTLLKQHFVMATHYLRVVDTARSRKHQIDSARIRDRILNAKIDHILKNQDANNKQSATYKAQAIVDRKTSDWIFWSAVAGIIILQVINVSYAYKNHVRKPKPYNL